MKIDNFAPVVIPTLNRFDHLKRCLDSLLKNIYATKTPIYIYLDAPTKTEHMIGYNKIIDYANEVSGFKSVTVIKREKNLGAVKNGLNAINETFDLHDELIFSEDDNYFSPNFLEYMNKGLQFFRQEKNIFAICGYNYSIQMPENYSNNFYLWQGFVAWGCGFWKDKYRNVDLTVNSVSKYIESPKNIYKLNRVANHYFFQLLKIVRTREIVGDIIFCMHLVKNNMFCIFPTISKVRNCGWDGTGFHCNKEQNNTFSSQSIDKKKRI